MTAPAGDDRPAFAVVPAYRPDVAALTPLVEGLRADGWPVLVVDDGSPDAAYLDDLAALGASTIRHESNAGIARSLNDGLRAAVAQGAQFLLTVDQDTVLPPGYVVALVDAFAGSRQSGRIGAIGAQTIGDASGDLHYPARIDGDLLVTHEVFQTGTLWSVEKLLAVGGFDESLGIDAVDAEACLSLREAGYLVALAPGVRLEHRYGNGRQVRLFGRTVVATGHSPQRRETMVRNRLHLFPRELKQSPTHAMRTLRRLTINTALALTIEQNRWQQVRATARALSRSSGCEGNR